MPAPVAAGACLAVLAILLSLVASGIVGLRVYTRLKLECFALDDWLMCTALPFFILACSSGLIATMHGLGNPDPAFKYGTEHGNHASTWFAFLQLFFAVAVFPIRSSIASNLLRFTKTPDQRVNRIALWVIMVLSLVSGTLFTSCVLLQGNGYETVEERGSFSSSTLRGEVHNAIENHWFSYFFAVFCIILDLAIATMPLCIFLKTQMTLARKYAVIPILMAAPLGCMATVVFLGLLIKYRDQPNLTGRADMSIAMLLDLFFGILCGSLPALKPLWEGRIWIGRVQQDPSGGAGSVPLQAVERI